MYSKEMKALRAKKKADKMRKAQIERNERDGRRAHKRLMKRSTRLIKRADAILGTDELKKEFQDDIKAETEAGIDQAPSSPEQLASLKELGTKDEPAISVHKVQEISGEEFKAEMQAAPAPLKPLPPSTIEITGVDLVAFVQKVYELSRPQGMGFLHSTPGGMDAIEAAIIVEQGMHNDLGYNRASDRTEIVLILDYVHGRACKMNVWKTPDGRLYIWTPWCDHSNEQLIQLLAAVGIKTPDTIGEHSRACNCRPCQVMQRSRAVPS